MRVRPRGGYGHTMPDQPPFDAQDLDELRDLAAGATVHPSSILRMPDDRRHEAHDAFVADLAGVAKLLQ